MSTHTPGPWTVTHDKKHNQQRISAGDAPVAVTKDEANARLIAAAPDMLAALKSLIVNDGRIQGVHLGALKRMVEAAIVKAEGAS